MVGYIYVVNSAYYTQPRANGTFVIRNVPPGRYELHAWHESAAAVVKQPLTVRARRRERYRGANPGRSPTDGNCPGQIREAPTNPAWLLMTPPTTKRPIPKRALLGVAVAAIVLAIPYVVDRVVTEARQRRVAEESSRKAREAAELARDALARADGGGGDDDRQRRRQPALPGGAARAGRPHDPRRSAVDRVLVGAVPESADRDLLRWGDARVLAGGGRRRRCRIGELMRQVGDGREAGVTADGAASGGAFLAAARQVPLGQGMCRGAAAGQADRRRRCWPRWPGDRAGRVLLSDGRRALAQWRPRQSRSSRRWSGEESSGDVALPEPGARARRGGDRARACGCGASAAPAELAQAAAAADRTRRQVSWAVAIPLALALAALSLRRRGRRDRRARRAGAHGVAARHARRGVDVGAQRCRRSPALPPMAPGPGTPLGRYLLPRAPG